MQKEIEIVKRCATLPIGSCAQEVVGYEMASMCRAYEAYGYKMQPPRISMVGACAGKNRDGICSAVCTARAKGTMQPDPTSSPPLESPAS
jgi:hypothetical protein